MPQIRTYKSQVNAPNPTDRGYRNADVEAAAAAGGAGHQTVFKRSSGTGGFLSEAGKGLSEAGQAYHTFQATNETSKLSADFARAQAALGDAWRNTIATADPNDTDTAAKFQREVVEPTLDSLGENIGTAEARQFFERQKASLSSDLFLKTNRDHADLAGLAAVQNAQTVGNQLTNSVAQNPDMWRGSIVRGDMAIDALPGLTTEQSLKLKQTQRKEIAAASILGFAHRDTAEAKSMLARPEFNSYLDAKDKEALGAQIDRIANAQASDSRQELAAKRAAAKAASDAEAQRIQAALIVDDTGQTVIPAGSFQAALTIGDPEQQRAVYGMLERIEAKKTANQPIHTDPAILQALVARVGIPEGQPGALSKAELRGYVANGLDTSGYNFVEGLMTEGQGTANSHMLDQTLRSVRQRVGATPDPVTGLVDPDGDKAYTAFLTQFMPAYTKAVQTGADPSALLAPSNPNYLGILKNAEVFMNLPSNASFMPLVTSPVIPRPAAPGTPSREQQLKSILGVP